MKLKNNKGFTGVDIAVSLVILLIFVSFIAALFYNLSNTSKRVERKTQATNIAIEFIEAMKATPFNNLLAVSDNYKIPTTITKEDFKNLTEKEINIPNGYTVKISIQNPKDSSGTESVEMGQVMKIITAEVTYRIGNTDTDEKVVIETLVKNI